MSKILLLTGENCPYCRKLEGALHNCDLLDKVKVRLLKPQEKEDMDFIRKYKISTFPTLLKLENEEEIDRLCGLQQLYLIKEFLNE